MLSVCELPREDKTDCRKLSQGRRRMVTRLPAAERSLPVFVELGPEAPAGEGARRSRAVVG